MLHQGTSAQRFLTGDPLKVFAIVVYILQQSLAIGFPDVVLVIQPLLLHLIKGQFSTVPFGDFAAPEVWVPFQLIVHEDHYVLFGSGLFKIQNFIIDLKQALDELQEWIYNIEVIELGFQLLWALLENVETGIESIFNVFNWYLALEHIEEDFQEEAV